MGRARGRTTSNFNAVLGGLRGSADAQTRRNAQECLLLEQDFQEFKDTVYKDSGWHQAVDTLRAAYDVGAHIPTDSGHRKLLASLQEQALGGGGSELLVIAAYGDPHAWPGLSAPAVQALGDTFSSILTGGPKTSIHLLGEEALRVCFSRARDLSYYQRLQPLCTGLGCCLNTQPHPGLTVLHELAAETLASAPGAALAGPLRQWIDSFVSRCQTGHLSVEERTVFAEAFEERAHDSEFTAASADLAQNLW